VALFKCNCVGVSSSPDKEAMMLIEEFMMEHISNTAAQADIDDRVDDDQKQ